MSVLTELPVRGEETRGRAELRACCCVDERPLVDAPGIRCERSYKHTGLAYGLADHPRKGKGRCDCRNGGMAEVARARGEHADGTGLADIPAKDAGDFGSMLIFHLCEI